jgi:alkylhydroperoxidase/carboxymuconolactone decarboxylase family protein YurZ
MTRVRLHTLETAEPSSRTVLQRVVEASPGVGMLNLWAAMAEAPATLDAYMAIRESIEAHATFDPARRSAIALAAAGATGGAYSTSINRRIAGRAGWSPQEIDEVRTATVADPRLGALLSLVREASMNRGALAASTWSAAVDAGWTNAELVEAFAIVALTWFVDGFAAYAQVEVDRPPANVEHRAEAGASA